MLTSLLLPIILSAVALFFASFLSWMVLPLHFKDWNKFAGEDELMKTVSDLKLPPGSYMFPGWDTPDEMKSEAYQQKYKAGPTGIMTVFGQVSMGKNLGLTFLHFLVVSFLLAYLGTMALPRGAEFLDVFRFISTAGLMTFLAAIVQHAIWFKSRIVGHVIESIGYAAITALIFAAMWPE
jgi:hypothetical protein